MLFSLYSLFNNYTVCLKAAHCLTNKNLRSEAPNMKYNASFLTVVSNLKFDASNFSVICEGGQLWMRINASSKIHKNSDFDTDGQPQNEINYHLKQTSGTLR